MGEAQPGWPHSGRIGALSVAAYCATMNTVFAAQRGKGQAAEAAVDLYGSEGQRRRLGDQQSVGR